MKKVGTGTERHSYYNSRWQLLEERLNDSPNAADPERIYVWGMRYIDDLILRKRDSNSNGTLDETLYALQDVHFNVIALWDPDHGADGDIVERYDYNAYGDGWVLAKNYGTKSGNDSDYDWTIRYSGYRHDSETRMYYVRNRTYHPVLGAWLQRDPIGYADGMNLYEYVGSGPTGYNDYLGNKRIKPWVSDPEPDWENDNGVVDDPDRWFYGRNSGPLDSPCRTTCYQTFSICMAAASKNRFRFGVPFAMATAGCFTALGYCTGNCQTSEREDSVENDKYWDERYQESKDLGNTWRKNKCECKYDLGNRSNCWIEVRRCRNSMSKHSQQIGSDTVTVISSGGFRLTRKERDGYQFIKTCDVCEWNRDRYYVTDSKVKWVNREIYRTACYWGSNDFNNFWKYHAGYHLPENFRKIWRRRR